MKIDRESLAKIHHVNRPKIRSLGRSFVGGEVLDLFPLIWYALLRPTLLVSGYVAFFGWIVLQVWQADRKDFAFLGTALILVLGIYLCVAAWVIYNRLRFVGKERRAAPKPVDSSEMDAFFQIREGLPDNFRNASSLEFYFEEDHVFRIRDPGTDQSVQGWHNPGLYIQPGRER